MSNFRRCLLIIYYSFSGGPIFDITFYLILILLSQLFKYLHGTSHCEYLNLACQGKKVGCILFVVSETPDHCWAFWRPVLGRDDISPIAPALGPWQKNGNEKKFAVHGGENNTKYQIPGKWHPSSYCMRHSWRTKFLFLSADTQPQSHLSTRMGWVFTSVWYQNYE